MTLTLENLQKSYGPLTVLNRCSFSFADGRIYCLMAPSGSGKDHSVPDSHGPGTGGRGRRPLGPPLPPLFRRLPGRSALRDLFPRGKSAAGPGKKRLPGGHPPGALPAAAGGISLPPSLYPERRHEAPHRRLPGHDRPLRRRHPGRTLHRPWTTRPDGK